MKTSRYSDSQILSILKQAAGGVPVSALCREHGMSSATFYKWRAKYGGMDASLMERMKELEKENAKLTGTGPISLTFLKSAAPRCPCAAPGSAIFTDCFQEK